MRVKIALKGAGKWFRQRLYGRKAPLFTAVAGTAIMGVMVMHTGSALSPDLPEEQRPRLARQQRESAVKEPSAKPAAPAKPPVVAPAQPLPSAPASSGHPWRLTRLYASSSSDASAQAQAWAASRPADAAVMQKLAAQPQARWFGDWSVNLQQDVAAYVGDAAAAGSMPVLVAYNIPARDCGQYSAGGAAAASAYRAWIQQMAAGIAGRPAVVILEPDALPMLTDCLDAAGQQARLSMLQQAVADLKVSPATYVYIDAGNPGWQSAATMADRLMKAGINLADGFSLNVSNFYTTAESVAYGTNLSKLAGGKHFVVDTSRNGKGVLSADAWCNPPGRALGTAPTAAPGLGPLVDALLWIKIPGQSDGTCNGGPSAGSWWADYALGLARNAGW